VNYHDNTNHDGLFDILGKAFAAQAAIATAAGTTLPGKIDDLTDAYNALAVTPELEAAVGIVSNSSKGARSAGSQQTTELQRFAQQFLIEFVHADAPLPQKTLANALAALVARMRDDSESVDASAVTVAATAGANTGDGVLIVSAKRGDGRAIETAFAETLIATCGAAQSIRVAGEPVEQPLAALWPGGSGANAGVNVTDAAASLLANGDMEDEDDVADAPDDWIVSVGTIGTTLKMTNPEVQTVAVSGTPTAGYYLLHWANAAGKTQTTGPIAWNASGSAVQSALRALRGLEAVAVATAGASPNYTHTVTFAGRGGNVAQLTSSNLLTGGTPAISHATTSAGTAFVYSGGKALEFDSDGSQLTTINQRIANLQPLTAYAVSLWAVADVVPAAGVFTVDLVDGIGGSVIADSQGANNAFTFAAADLTTSWQHLSELVSGECVFRTPEVLPPLVYLRIRISTAVDGGTSVFVDHVALAAMLAAYAGGPLLAAFSGATAFEPGDSWEVAVTNDRAGVVQEWCERNFGLAALGLLLPSDAGGTETIPDSVVG